MEIMRAKLMSISVYKNILETEPMKALLRLTEAKTADALIRSYTDLVYSVWSEGFSTLPDYISWHLKYDESFIGNAIAAGTAPQFMEDAAAMDIRRLSSVAMLSCSGLKRNIANACSRLGEEYTSIIQNLAELPMGRGFQEEEIFESYRKKGCGQFALGRAFHWEKGQLTQVKHSDPIDQRDMIGYEFQRNAVVENTRVMLSGKPTNNVLLYGDSGTGKSTTIKAIINEYYDQGLRMIEIYKHQFQDLSQVISQIKNRNYRFIIYMDDLSFEEFETEYKYLKAVIEGGLEIKPDNVLIYATSNRRHLIRETWTDRTDLENNNGMHKSDTMQEKLSLVNRFGVTINYSKPSQKEYFQIVVGLAEKNGIHMTEEELCAEANKWELSHGGISGRTAQQFINYLAGKQE